MTNAKVMAPEVGQWAQVVRTVRPVEWMQWVGLTHEAAQTAWLEALLLSALTAVWPEHGAVRTLRALQCRRVLRDDETVTARAQIRGVHAGGFVDCLLHAWDATGQQVAQADRRQHGEREAAADHEAEGVGDAVKKRDGVKEQQEGQRQPAAEGLDPGAADVEVGAEAEQQEGAA